MYNPYDTEKYPVRKNTRLDNFDYSSGGYYFITICTYDKMCIFGKPDALNDYGNFICKGLEEIPKHYPDVFVDKFVVMPNHIHAILYLTGDKSKLYRVVGSLKSFVTKKVHDIEPNRNVWQRSFHDHIIRNEQSYQKIWAYIEGNPMNWEKDCFYMG